MSKMWSVSTIVLWMVLPDSNEIVTPDSACHAMLTVNTQAKHVKV